MKQYIENKIDVTKMNEKELIEYVNKHYKEDGETTLQKISEETNVSKSYINTKLKNWGYSFKSKQYVKAPKKDAEEIIFDINAYVYFTKSFNKQISYRINADTDNSFNELANTKLSNIAKAKLVSLALQEFVDKYK